MKDEVNDMNKLEKAQTNYQKWVSKTTELEKRLTDARDSVIPVQARAGESILEGGDATRAGKAITEANAAVIGVENALQAARNQLAKAAAELQAAKDEDVLKRAEELNKLSQANRARRVAAINELIAAIDENATIQSQWLGLKSANPLVKGHCFVDAPDLPIKQTMLETLRRYRKYG